MLPGTPSFDDRVREVAKKIVVAGKTI